MGILMSQTLVESVSRPEKTIIVITDGKPNVEISDFGTNESDPVRQSAYLVNQAKRNGIKVIGLGVGLGSNDQNMKQMFGAYGFVDTNMNNLSTVLLDMYRDQMSIQV